jgi:hypothetical protein
MSKCVQKEIYSFSPKICKYQSDSDLKLIKDLKISIRNLGTSPEVEQIKERLNGIVSDLWSVVDNTKADSKPSNVECIVSDKKMQIKPSN